MKTQQQIAEENFKTPRQQMIERKARAVTLSCAPDDPAKCNHPDWVNTGLDSCRCLACGASGRNNGGVFVRVH